METMSLNPFAAADERAFFCLSGIAVTIEASWEAVPEPAKTEAHRFFCVPKDAREVVRAFFVRAVLKLRGAGW